MVVVDEPHIAHLFQSVLKLQFDSIYVSKGGGWLEIKAILREFGS